MRVRSSFGPARRIRRAIREPPGWRLASLAEGRGLSVITVCGYRRETRASLSIARDLVVGSKLFLSSGREGRDSAPRES